MSDVLGPEPGTDTGTGSGRRALLAAAGAALACGGATAGGGCAAPSGGAARVAGAAGARGKRSSAASGPESARGFHGARQAGIRTAQTARVSVVAFDLDPGVRGAAGAARLRTVLVAWTKYLAAETAARPGLEATVGIGPGLPAKVGVRAPALLRELPAFPGDRLADRWSGGDLVVQMGAPGADAAGRAVDGLTGLGRGVLRPRWRQVGFLPDHGAGRTPRNLLGFKDGTVNPTPAESERWVWVPSGADRDGSYLVVRRIRLLVDRFAALSPSRQEAIIGRHRASGAPLGHDEEHEPIDLFAKTPEGRYVLPADAHVRLAHSRLDGGARMLRRGYSYRDGPQDQGLLFLAYMKDPAIFVRVQERLAASDALGKFTVHEGSGVYFALPGAPPGSSLGERLFGT
ncbi:Dyp-type peroxidase [Streptomyces sp. NPDC097619]|uniref:Dyp-type peroxidase n=1 Tax=Streptomyces sp. NPDC097619 TaxID=3157228 RepID=UPI0033280FD0